MKKRGLVHDGYILPMFQGIVIEVKVFHGTAKD